MASLDDMQKIVQSAYQGKTLLEVGGFKLLFSLPTIKFYIKDQVIIVSIRGTADSTDVASWPNVAIGTLDRTSRYQTDLQALLECQKYYPQSEYYYVGAGHSLGAAIMDRFLQMGLLSQGLSYNGAVEPQFVYNNPKHRRIYNAADPLYNIVGRFIPGVEVRPISIATGLASLLNPFYASYRAHMLSNFEGGGIPKQYLANLTKTQRAKQTALINKSKIDYKDGKVVDRPKVSSRPTKRSIYAVRFETKYGFPITDKRVKTTFPDTDIKTILSKGAGAYGSSGSRPNVSIAQWSYARLASVLTGGPSLRVDKDLVGPISLQKIKA